MADGINTETLVSSSKHAKALRVDAFRQAEQTKQSLIETAREATAVAAGLRYTMPWSARLELATALYWDVQKLPTYVLGALLGCPAVDVHRRVGRGPLLLACKHCGTPIYARSRDELRRFLVTQRLEDKGKLRRGPFFRTKCDTCKAAKRRPYVATDT